MVKFTAPDLPKRLEADHYTDQNGNMALTERFLLKRGVCCGLGCRHCPYTPRHQAGNKDVSDAVKACLKSATQSN